MAKNKHCDLRFLYQFQNSRPADLFENTCFVEALSTTPTDSIVLTTSTGRKATITLVEDASHNLTLKITEI